MSSGLILGIETSNPSAAPAGSTRPGVAVALREHPLRVLGAEAIDASKPNEDDLQACIHRLFQRLSLRPRDLRAIAVSIGPGGFTAIRLAVTAAKVMTEATGAACLPVPTAHVVARRVRAPGRFAVALASKGESTYVTVFEPGDGGPRATSDGRLMEASDLAGLGVVSLVVDQFAPESMRRRAAELGIAILPPEFDPVACIEAGLNAAPVDPASLLPLYPREPEAVTKWKKLHAAQTHVQP